MASERRRSRAGKEEDFATMSEAAFMKALREFQKEPDNKRCADCKERGPQYLCLNFNTFVCTTCSGVHREFNFRVKGISMSTFTGPEVEAIVKHGGNAKARALFLAR